MNIKSEEQKQIILTDFDFNKVNVAMNSLGWKWKQGNRPASIPTINELKQVATLCLDKVSESNDDNAIFSMGGFEAEKTENTLELRFILERANPLNALLNPSTDYEVEG